MSDLSDWFKSVPFFTRYWFGCSVGLSLIGRLGLVDPLNLVLLYEPLKRFQIWRLVTCVFFYPINPKTGFHFLLNMYFLYNYSRRLETEAYAGKPSDYLFMLLFNWICCVIVGLVADIMLIMDPMILSVLYVWCQLNSEVIVNFWFGTRFKALYLPWILLGFNMILSGGGMLEIIGIIVGHVYYVLKFKFPEEQHGFSFLQTPAILKHWFPDQSSGVHGFGYSPRAPPANPNRGIFRGHNWGTGHVLRGN